MSLWWLDDVRAVYTGRGSLEDLPDSKLKQQQSAVVKNEELRRLKKEKRKPAGPRRRENVRPVQIRGAPVTNMYIDYIILHTIYRTHYIQYIM